jgi:DNA (cytosine-5)-methyltransferase 1
MSSFLTHLKNKNAYYNEFNPEAAQWIRELIKLGVVAPGEVDERSIVDVKADDLRGFSQYHFFAGIGGWSRALRLAGWRDDRPCFTGSPPCQPFSVAGKQKGIKDERHLWPIFFNLIKEVKPPVVFGEQVASAEIIGSELEASFVEAVRCGDYARANKLSKQIFSQPNFNEYPRWIDNLQADLERESYAMRFTVLGAHSAGAPHIRQRIFFIAERQMENSDSAIPKQPPRSGSGTREAPGSGAFDKSYGSSPVNGMGDTIDKGLERYSGNGDGSHEPGRINQKPNRPTSETSSDGRLANASNNGHSAANGLREEAESSEQAGKNNFGESMGSCDDIGMANSEINGIRTFNRESGQGAGSEKQIGGHGVCCGVGDSERSELQGSVQLGLSRKVDCETGPADESTGTNTVCDSGTPATNSPDGFWANPDWLFCRDGKWRPVKSSVQLISDELSTNMVCGGNISSACYPLAKDGQEARAMRLKGYGNAIAPEIAAKVVAAYMQEVKQ